MNTTFLRGALIAATFAGCAGMMATQASAQNQVQNGPVTRAQVKEQLKELEAAGYEPNDWVDYPQNIQDAERRVQEQHAAKAAHPVAPQ